MRINFTNLTVNGFIRINLDKFYTYLVVYREF